MACEGKRSHRSVLCDYAWFKEGFMENNASKQSDRKRGMNKIEVVATFEYWDDICNLDQLTTQVAEAVHKALLAARQASLFEDKSDNENFLDTVRVKAGQVEIVTVDLPAHLPISPYFEAVFRTIDESIERGEKARETYLRNVQA